MLKIGINGFGRIGRDLFRQTLGDTDINIVSISDTADKANLIYLLKYDSIYGKLDAEIEESETGIVVNGKEILFNSWKNGDEANWDELNTDIVVLATGKPKTKEEVDKKLAEKDILINELRNQIGQLLEKVGDTYNNNTYNIMIKPFGKENTSYITADYVNRIINDGPVNSIPKLIKYIHLNKKFIFEWPGLLIFFIFPATYIELKLFERKATWPGK